MERYNGTDIGDIDARQFLNNFVKTYEEEEKERLLYGDEKVDFEFSDEDLEDVDFEFEISDEMDHDLSKLQKYVYDRVEAMEDYYSQLFVEKSLKTLFKKVYTLRSQPGLPDLDKRIIDDLLEYIYDCSSAYRECFNAWKIELDAMKEASSNVVKKSSR